MIDIEKLKSEIVQQLKPLNLDKIILFGSYAYGKPHQDSDIDLYVVTKDDFIPSSWREKSEIYSNVISRIRHIVQEYPTDLIVHTKKMHERFLEINSDFSKELTSKGVRLL